MYKFKNFIKCRSKLLFISFIISLVLFLLLVPEFLKYSDFIKQIIDPKYSQIEIADGTIGELIWNTHATEAFQEFNLIFSSIFVFITLFNLVGYIYKKNEFIFISVGLGIVITCMSVYVADLVFVILIALATILNILGYIEQYLINEKR